MVRLVRTLIAAGAIALLGAAVPTPGPGTAVPLSQPSPTNPVQYVVAPGAIGSAAALNSTFYKVYSDLSGVIASLNGCNYIPGAAVGTIVATSPLNVAIGACSSGTGTGATATLSLGGVVPPANLPTAPTYSGLNVNGPVVTVASQVALQAQNAPNTAALVVNNSTGSYNAFRVDVSSTGGAVGVGLASGQNVPMPYDAGGGAIGPQVTEHTERKLLTAASAGTVGFTFLIAYTVAPNCTAASYGGANTIYVTTITTTSTGVNFATAGNAQLICVGY